MKRCRLGEFKKYCWLNYPSKYLVEVKHHLKATFDDIEILTFPDSICFRSDDGNCLSIYGITHLMHEENKFVVYCDYYGVKIEIRISCLS